jgi:hypothetical protein
VVKIYFDPVLGRYVTADSFLAKQDVCDFRSGLCADEERRQGRDNVDYMGSLKNLGLSVIDFRRSFVPADQFDAPISLDGPTQVCRDR